MRKKEVELEHNNLFEDGVEGILMDLDEALQLPEELYIANKFQVSFDENGTIQRMYAFMYGKNETGEKKTYLIDYDADSSNDMTLWIDGKVNGEYSDDMRLSPMIEILNNSDWTSQVKAWAEAFEEQQTYEILYMGRRAFRLEEGLQYISGDADGDGTETGTANLTQLKSGGKILGFEVSLHIPDLNSITPVRYIMEPEYISQQEVKQQNTMQQVEDFDYLNMPEKEDDTLTITVTTDAAEKDGSVFQSTDYGATWEYKGLVQTAN